MNFEPTEDQNAFLGAVQRIADRHRSQSLNGERFQYSPMLQADLSDAGLFDCLGVEELGGVAAAEMVIALSQLPVCAEVAASTLVGPWLCPELPGPYAMLWGAERTARFLPEARTLLHVDAEGVQALALQPGDSTPVDSIFAYPMGVLRELPDAAWMSVVGADLARLHQCWRVGVAAEICGCLLAGLKSVVEHVTHRRQFGRPLGSFQALQHRLAECATLVQSARWLTLKAAETGHAGDASLAAGYAQDMARKVAYDLHQFMGAMGLTLEHPLHRWTYRTKLLSNDLGGWQRQYAAAARQAWPTRHPDKTQTHHDIEGATA